MHTVSTIGMLVLLVRENVINIVQLFDFRFLMSMLCGILVCGVSGVFLTFIGAPPAWVMIMIFTAGVLSLVLTMMLNFGVGPDELKRVI